MRRARTIVIGGRAFFLSLWVIAAAGVVSPGAMAQVAASDLVRCGTLFAARAAAESGQQRQALRRASASYFVAAKTRLGGLESPAAHAALRAQAATAADEIEASVGAGDDETIEAWVRWCAAQGSQVEAMISGR